MNLLFGGRLRYYTGPCVYRSDVANECRTRAHGSMFVAEVLIRLLPASQTYVEVGLQPLSRSSRIDENISPPQCRRRFWPPSRACSGSFVCSALSEWPTSPEVRVAHNDPVVPSR